MKPNARRNRLPRYVLVATAAIAVVCICGVLRAGHGSAVGVDGVLGPVSTGVESNAADGKQNPRDSVSQDMEASEAGYEGASPLIDLSDFGYVASVERDGQTHLFESFDEAAAYSRDGDVIYLLGDSQDIYFTKDEGVMGSIVLDLNGHDVNSITLNSSMDVEIASRGSISGVGRGRILGRSWDNLASITNLGVGNLVVSGIDIVNIVGNAKTYGILSQGGGDIEVRDVRIQAAAERVEVHAISQQNESSGRIVVDGGEISVQTTSADVAAYGIYSAFEPSAGDASDASDEQEPTVEVRDSSISVTGGNTYVCGILSWGDMSLDGTDVSVATQWTDASGDEAIDTRRQGVWLRRDGSSASFEASTVSFNGEACTLEGAQDAELSLDVTAGNSKSAEGAAAHAVVQNRTSGEAYESLSSAVEAADAGDEIELLEDATSTEALSIDEDNLTLDLGGHTLQLVPQADAASELPGALDFCGGETLTISGGRLEVSVGASVETEDTADAPYIGISNSGDGMLALESMSVDVRYSGATSIYPEISLYGIGLSSGSLTVSASTIDAYAASVDDTFGATYVEGIHVSSGDAETSAAVSADSQISAHNNASPISGGVIGYPNLTNLGTRADQHADLIELEVDEGSELYDQVQQAFRVNADYDAETDGNGYVWGTGVYYAAPMTISSGLAIWAYSDPYTDAEAGYPDNITATHFFVRSDYQVAQDAYAISTGEDFAGAVDVSGRLYASTGGGHAAGIYEDGSGSINVDEASVEALCSLEYYRIQNGTHDLRAFIGFEPAQESVISYPEQSANTSIVQVASESAAQMRAGGWANAIRTAPITYEELFSGMEQDVNITFIGMRDDSGNMQEAETFSVAWAGTLSERGAEVPVARDFSQGGIDYRFVGWKLEGDETDYCAYTSEAISQTVMDSTIPGVTDGEVVYEAQYTPVQEGQHLIIFVIEGMVFGYAVDDGTTPSFVACYNLGEGQSPEAFFEDTGDSGYSYTFTGYVANNIPGTSFATAQDSSSSQPISGDLPAAVADAAYTAQFDISSITTTINLFYMRPSVSGGYVYSDESISDLPWGGDAIGDANTRVAVGSTIEQEGVVYTLLGWSTRISDKAALYTDTLPTGHTTDDFFDDQVTYYGIYQRGRILGRSDVDDPGGPGEMPTSDNTSGAASDTASGTASTGEAAGDNADAATTGSATSVDAESAAEPGASAGSGALPEAGGDITQDTRSDESGRFVLIFGLITVALVAMALFFILRFALVSLRPKGEASNGKRYPRDNVSHESAAPAQGVPRSSDNRDEDDEPSEVIWF